MAPREKPREKKESRNKPKKKSSKEKVIVLLPAYKEAPNLKTLVPAIDTQLKRWCAKQQPTLKHEIVVVNDKSGDGTEALIQRLSKKHAVTLQNREKKEGLGAATIAGMEAALAKKPRWVVVMDSDHSHDPKDLPLLLDRATGNDGGPGAEVVIGSRYAKGGRTEGWPASRRILSKIANTYARVLLRIKAKDTSTAYRVYDAKTLEKALPNIKSRGYTFQEEALYHMQRAGGRIDEIGVVFKNREKGSSNMPLASPITGGWDLLQARTNGNAWGLVGMTLILALFLGLQLLTIHAPLKWDEAAYLGNARDTYGMSNYTEHFRNPLLGWVIGTVWLVTGESIVAGRLVSVAAATLSLLLLYLIARKRTRLALLITGLVALNGQYLFWAGYAYAEALTTLCILGGAWAVERAERWKPKKGTVKKLKSFWNFWRGDGLLWFLAGVAFGLSFLARFASAILVALTFSYLLLRKRWRPLIIYSTGVFTVTVPWLIRNAILYGHPLWDLLEQGRTIATYTTWQPATSWLLMLLLSGQGLLILILLGLIATQGDDDWLPLLWAFNFVGILLLHVFIMRLKFPRYELALLPFLALVAAAYAEDALHFAEGLWERWELKKKLHVGAQASLALLLILGALPGTLVGTGLMTDAHNCEPDAIPAAADTLATLIATDMTEEAQAQHPPIIASNSWVYFGFLNNVQAYSLYTTNWTEIYQNVTPQYILYSNKNLMGYPYSSLENETALGNLIPAGHVSGACDTIEFWRVRYPGELAKEWAGATTTARIVTHQ